MSHCSLGSGQRPRAGLAVGAAGVAVPMACWEIEGLAGQTQFLRIICRWKLSDTNTDGLLDYIEFAQRIAEAGTFGARRVSCHMASPGHWHQHHGLSGAETGGGVHSRRMRTS